MAGARFLMIGNIQQAAAAVHAADALLFTAGAGMGVDSGLPYFRGNEGFWNAYPIAARMGLSFAQMANPLWFKEDPELAWAFYGHRLNLYRRTTPHAGFSTLLRWATQKEYFVFTSNVDGHFQKSGFDSERIEECHGSIHYFQCVEGCSDSIWDASIEQVVVDESAFRALPPLPRCRHCGGLARPNILMFGDLSWIAGRSNAQRQRLQDWLQQLGKISARLAVIELGAGTAIPTVRHTSEATTRRWGGKLIRINLRESETSAGHFGLAARCLDGIQELDIVLKQFHI